MRATALAIALLMAGTATAQTTGSTSNPNSMDPGQMTNTVDVPQTNSSTADTTGQTNTDMSTHSGHDMSADGTVSSDSMSSQTATTDQSNNWQSGSTMANGSTGMAGNQSLQPGNTNPERDARGILVRSDPAMVPAGWNGTSGSGVGGPMVDPATGEANSGSDYPPCTAARTDNCVQTYERGRAR